MLREWMERNWFRWLVKGGLGIGITYIVFRIGEWFYRFPFPVNSIALLILLLGYGYVVEEIGLYSGEGGE